jgi:2-keto-3-deoxy-L-rhamnonate aldolase RhmA
MSLVENKTLRKMRAGELALGFGVHVSRGSLVPVLANAAGYDWLFIDMEHGALSVDQACEISIAALAVGITPIVRVCSSALHEGTRALDNGAMGVVVPHVDTVQEAEAVVRAYRYPPTGMRSWGGIVVPYGLRPPGPAEAQAALNREVAVIAMIETPEAVQNVDAIAAVDGIDVLLIGSSDLSTTMGIPGQFGHQRIQDAYKRVSAACKKHGRILGMGGIYDREWVKFYLGMGARFVLGGADHGFMLAAATDRAKFLREVAAGA